MRFTVRDGYFRRLYQFRVDRNCDLVSNRSGQGAHPEILSVNFRRGRGAHALALAHGIFDRLAGPIHVEHNLFGHTLDGKVAGDLQFARATRLRLLGMKGDSRKFLYIEKARAAQIVVAHFHTGVYGIGVDGSFQRELRGVRGIILRRSRDFGERASHCGESEMAHRKLRRRVIGIDLPGHSLGCGRGGHGERSGKNKNETEHICNSPR